MRRSANAGCRHAARAFTHGSSVDGTSSGAKSPGKTAGGFAGPFSSRPSAVMFGTANRCAVPFGRKWNPDSHSTTSGIVASRGIGPDSMIERRYGQIGTATAAVAQTVDVQQPAATSTRRAETSPSRVRTPVTRSPSRRIDSTARSSRRRAPASCADPAIPASACTGSP